MSDTETGRDAPDAEVLALTRRLVSIPSHDDETAAGNAIEAWLREETDATVTRDDHGNVLAERGPTDAPSLALVGHHDVVPPASSQTDGDEYVVEERDGRLHGRGTADMKGAVAAAMCAFRDADPACRLRFVSFVGEERGGLGARAALADGFAVDYAVVGEGSTGYSAPGVTDVAVAHKGRRGSTITASGTSAHASEVDRGENAVYRACDAVEVVRSLPFPETTVLGHEMAGSVAVTEIEGGSAWNVIPERCAVTVDERTVPGRRADLGRVEGVEGVSWTVDQDLPPMACDDADFADLVREAAADATGLADADAVTGRDVAVTGRDVADADDGDPRLVTKPHATDAGWLADAGATCVVCGPAEPGEAHTDDESVSIDVLGRCYRTYLATADRFDAG